MSARVAVVHHLERPFLGHVASLAEHGLELREVDRRRGRPLPAPGAFEAIVSLGGEDSVRDPREHPYLAEELPWLADAARAGVPVLGICLGGQLLSLALGGEVRRMPRRTVRWLRAVPVAEDPLAAALPPGAPILHWNEDAFTLPPGGVEVLEAHDGGIEAFRWGECAWGVQFHPDVTGAALDGWYELRDLLEQAGVDEAHARAQDALHLPAHDVAARALLAAFARVVRERTAAAPSRARPAGAGRARG